MSRRHSAWDEVFIELDNLKSTGDHSSLLDSPRSQSSLTLKKFKNNRVGSPVTTPDSTSSASLSPATQNAFFAKSKIKLQPISTQSENSSDRLLSSEQSRSDDNKSTYREQLRNRFLSVKQQAEYSAKQVKKRHSVKTGTLIKQEDAVLESEIAQREEKLGGKFHQKFLEKINPNEFFCKTNFQEEAAVEVVENIEEKQTVLELLNLTTEDDIIKFSKPEISLLNYEENLIHFTGEKKESRVDFVPRYLEEEGIYVGAKPQLKPKMLLILEEQVNGKQEWYGCDGTLKLMSDPRRETPLKPIETPEIPTSFQIPFIPNSIQIPDRKYSLKLHLSKIYFRHHPLFSPEHYLSVKLKSLCKEYMEKDNELEKKLGMLRQARDKIQETQELSEKQKERLSQYREDIKLTRELWLDDNFRKRQIVKAILKTWKQLKLVREKQKFINTSLRLVIKKQVCSYTEEKETWNQAIENHVEEVFNERTLEYQIQTEIYRKSLKQWRTDPVSEEKPKKPILDFNKDSIREEVLNRFLDCLKPPGEPFLHFEFENDQEITQNLTYPREKARRNAVSKTKIVIKISINEKEIFRSKPIQLNEQFVCNINETIPIESGVTPTEIEIEITESQGSVKKTVFEKVTTRISPQKKFKTDFQSDRIFTFSHTGIGTDNLEPVFSSYGIDVTENVNLNGYITFRTTWDSFPPTISPLKTINLDPQDPLNTELLKFVQEDSNEFFRINQDIFCTDDDLEGNLRFRMLSLRNKGEPEFRRQMIPNREKDIDPNVFGGYESRLQEELNEDLDEGEIDSRRQIGVRQYYQIRKRVMEMSKTKDYSYSLKDVLVDDEVPDLGLLGSTIMKFFQPKRPLRPTRKTLTQLNIAPTIRLQTEFKIVINIVQAFQVPTRRMQAQDVTISPSRKSVSDIFSLIPVRPLVIATYGKQTLSTTTAEGANPTWNQELILNFHRKNGTASKVYINLFDEQMVDLLEDDRLRESDVYQRRQLHWLGCLEVSLDTITQNNRVEGTFEMQTPMFILGYDKQVQNKDQVIDLSPRSTTNPRDATFLNLFVTVIPSMNGVNTLQDHKLECNEPKNIKGFIQDWLRDFTDEFPNRSFPVLVKDSTCKTSCITRLLKDLNPPNAEGEDSAMELFCSRFVSVIPFVESEAMEFSGLWLTADQLLKLQIGTICDHAVLLQCYFMALKLESWLGLGYSIQHGKSAFVLVQQTSGKETFYSIFNPSNGRKYEVQDAFNPIKRIFCLINHENVWANIQKEDHLDLMSLNVTKSSDWLPLFNKQTPSATGTLQPSYIEYPSYETRSLEERIENKLKIKIMKWRKHMRTIWNRHASNIYRKLLPILEQHKLQGDAGVLDPDPDLTLDLQNIMNTYKVYGFSLNLAYTNVKSVIDLVRRTCVHSIDTPNIEFALAVYVHNYVGGFCTIWIFLGTLIRRR